MNTFTASYLEMAEQVREVLDATDDPAERAELTAVWWQYLKLADESE